jgi:predicted thioesterase
VDDLVGRRAELWFTVSQEDLATALGSGDVPVLATPRLIAWLEAATVAAIGAALPPGATSVGTAVDVAHLAASSLGCAVTVSALVVAVDGRSITLECAAHAADTVIARGRITRAIVDRQRFLARLPA